MVKVCIPDYPAGSFKGQKTPGFYMDGALSENLDIYARKISDDMQFLGICSSSTFEVRTGKSTLIQQIGSYYTDRVNFHNKTKITFNEKNIVFRSEDLIKRANELPKHSILILDEGDDLTEHHSSKIARELKRFFRKSGQLNLFIMLILPNFFELPKNYAISRSNFLINVKFFGEFSRGYFEFYSFNQKKWLYIRGKKNEDWSVASPSFKGRFIGLYTIDEALYRKMKDEDLKNQDEATKERKLTKSQILKRYRIGMITRFRKFLPEVETIKVIKVLGIANDTYYDDCSHIEEFPKENSTITKGNN